jgi:hypothetical protein
MATLAPAPDLVPRLPEGSHDCLRLSHCKERVQAAPAHLTLLHEGIDDYRSNSGLSSIYCHRLPLAAAQLTAKVIILIITLITSRARIIAGLSGFLTLIQSRDGPERYGAVIRFDTMPSRPMRQACWNTSAPSPSVWSLRTMPIRRLPSSLASRFFGR